ncbi:hypothetical protein [Kitasatospora purpeofusca]|uniref:hypothetical protein n=1 Tax=Kitasatospora purpeofusca TaxID=67352 RepID=UPI00365B6330
MWPARGIATLALFAVFTGGAAVAPAAAAAPEPEAASTRAGQYQAGEYTMELGATRILDMWGTIAKFSGKAKVHGQVTLSHGGKTIVRFKASRGQSQTVTEHQHPLSAGKSYGIVFPYGNTKALGLRANFTGDRSKDEPFVFHINLSEGGTVLADLTQKVWPDKMGSAPFEITRGNATVQVDHRMDYADAATAKKRQWIYGFRAAQVKGSPVYKCSRAHSAAAYTRQDAGKVHLASCWVAYHEGDTATCLKDLVSINYTQREATTACELARDKGKKK